MSFACNLSFRNVQPVLPSFDNLCCPSPHSPYGFSTSTTLIRLWSVVGSQEPKVLLRVKVEESALRSALVTHANKCSNCDTDQGSDCQELVFRRSVLDIEKDL